VSLFFVRFFELIELSLKKRFYPLTI